MKWFKNQFYKMRELILPPQSGEVEYQYYIRSGDCNQCGLCCTGIALVHHNSPIRTIDEFEHLKRKHQDYRHFEPIEETPHGVVFKCKNLTQDNTCGIHNDRPAFCRKYPSEATLLLGGQLAPECSYTFTKKIAFQSVISAKSNSSRWSKILKSPASQAGKIVNDVLLPVSKSSN